MRVAVGVLSVLIVGALIGRASAPSAVPPQAAPLTAGPTSDRAGVRVGFSRTRQGAVLAAGSYQQAFADRAILKPGILRKRIEAVATPRFAPVMREVNEPGAWRLRVGAFGQGVRSHLASAFFGVPVAYRVLSFSRQRAVVQTWGFTLLGNVTSVEPTAYFGLARTVLAWRDGDWKIADTRASFGPTPRLASPRPGGEGLSLVELTQKLRPYALAP